MATTNKKTTPKGAGATVTIAPPNLKTLVFKIRGTAPYVQNKFSAKARQQMKEAQEAGGKNKNRSAKQPKDFKKSYEQAIHRSDAGWCGIPAPAFRNACISACRVAGLVMTKAKLSVFVEADGFDADDATPLVKITKGKPEYFESLVRLETGVCDIHPRPKWAPGWEAKVRIRFDADQFETADMANLLMRAGQQVGIGEGRPDSKKSCGMGWGLFEVCGKE